MNDDCYRCGHPHAWHEHYTTATDCVCRTCPAFQRPSWWRDLLKRTRDGDGIPKRRPGRSVTENSVSSGRPGQHRAPKGRTGGR